MQDYHESRCNSSDLVIKGTDLTIVVPTLNERENLEPLLALVTAVLGDVSWEVIFVDDDSSDGTADHARVLARRNARVRCLHRIGRRGLATACIEGVLASASPYVAIMDGDLQHDEQLLPHMLDVLRSEPVDLVVGSRYVAGGEVGEGLSGTRARVSGFATWLARFICKAEIADPMSGFFMLRREVFERAVGSLSQQGFKILLRSNRRVGAVRSHGGPLERFDTRCAELRGSADRRRDSSDDLQLLSEQRLHLSRSTVARMAACSRTFVVLPDLQYWRGGEYRDCHLRVPYGPNLVGRGHRRRSRRLSMELRRLLGFHLEETLAISVIIWRLLASCKLGRNPS